jgi:hypothetical protein
VKCLLSTGTWKDSEYLPPYPSFKLYINDNSNIVFTRKSIFLKVIEFLCLKVSRSTNLFNSNWRLFVILTLKVQFNLKFVHPSRGSFVQMVVCKSNMFCSMWHRHKKIWDFLLKLAKKRSMNSTSLTRIDASLSFCRIYTSFLRIHTPFFR